MKTEKENLIQPESEAPKRDASGDKKKILKGILIIAIVFVALLALLGGLSLVYELITPEPEETSLYSTLFFEADYNKNIYEDKLYMRLDRDIHYNQYGMERSINKDNAASISKSAVFFVDYFKCIADGNYSKYPLFFTEEYIKNDNAEIPEKFTMQGIYDINVKLHKREQIENTDDIREIYEVSYRIFENNGTFRDDIYPDETRTLIFELRISQGEVKISAIGHRS